MFGFRAPRFDGVRPLIALALAAALLAPVAGNAQGFGFPGGSLVTADMNHSLSVFHPGSVGYVAITADIAAGWHINAEKPLESYLIPTVLAVSAPPGIEIVRLLYPAPVLRKLEISETNGPGALRPNVRRIFKTYGEGDARHKTLVCREIDTNLATVRP